MSKCSFSIAPTYLTLNSAQASVELLPAVGGSQSVAKKTVEKRVYYISQDCNKPELLVESVSRLATVLDLERPPKLESTDWCKKKERQRERDGVNVTFKGLVYFSV